MSILHNLTALNFLAVGAGAALRAWARWLLGLALNPLFIAVPLGTLAANVVGGYLVGVAVGLFHINTHFPLAWKLFAITGFLGGLTTFSTFSAEVVERLLAGQPAWGVTHDDEAIWGLVAFLQQLPTMDATVYAAFTQNNGEADHDQDAHETGSTPGQPCVMAIEVPE